ncbi:ABC transporter ATP-binding protein/permease [Alteromonas sp. C1M14]|uniref:ABCB family ABC transporter ATP-binding protein/permease n=1 Tax=Alteromonas sp. C1M14 TaxID=2841567 RepID=UPI001C09A8B1|nr:ABC transporter ATP-binding protein/permease [Alteromonas sp. C1M14]MBU2977457.1 ABC transporter ATP-binding protein/permease [Alteromonas sp. C1M14]
MRPSRFTVPPDTPVRWHALGQLWPYLLEFKTRIVFALGCLVLAKMAGIGLPFVLKHVVDDLNTQDPSTGLVAVPVALIVAYGTLRLLNVIIGEIRDTLFGRVTERAMRRMGLNVFNHLHSLDLTFHLNRQTGGLSRDIERGITGISFLMRFLVFNIGPTLLEIAVVVGLLLVKYGVSYAAIILCSVIAYVLYSMKTTNWRTRFVKAMNEADSTTHSRAVDSLLNFETVKYFNNEQYEAGRYDQELAQWEVARRKNRLSLFALNGGQAFIIASAMTAMLANAANGVAQGEMTIGDFVLINAFTMQIFMPLNFLGFVYREIRGAMANIDNMFTLLATKPSVQDDPQAPDLTVTRAQIEFRDVSFGYSAERPILKKLNFTLPAGKKTAIVGASGAGKSTIIKLLFRFYDTTAGSIFIDGTNIAQVNQASVRKQLGIVPQDTVLFNDTLYENIRYGAPDASDADIENAINTAHLSEFIAQLPDKANTRVGERGLKLSGGEKQRVAIARALLKNAPILVFDEATSSLDSGSEHAILHALTALASNHTSLVIAHRLSTITDADNILVMNAGEITEQGTHADLLATHGDYAKLWHMQQSNKE